jgi:peptide/nickel transport system substrate-binding protein
MRSSLLRRLGLLFVGLFAFGAAAPAATVRFDIAADPANLNPLFAHADAASVEAQLARLVFEPFIDIDERGRPFPELLARIPTLENGGLSRDGRTIVYKLRPNVDWSDGVPVTSRDVLFTLHAILDPRNSVRSREGYDLIDRASAPDAHTVVIHLKRAWAPAVATFFSYGSAPQYVLPAHLLEHAGPLERAAFNRHPLGDGPYLFVAWRRGERLEYAANPRYWRGEPATKRLDVGIVPDPGTNLTLLQSGSLDWNLIAPDQQAIVERDPRIGFRYVPLAMVAGIVLNTAHPPLDDVRVRRAIAESIDRNAISQKIALGKYPVVDTAQPLGSWARDPSVKEPDFDPAGADRALDAAGWLRGRDGIRTKGGRRLSLVYVQFPETRTGVAAATFIQSELRARGIDVTIKSISNAQLFLPKTGILATGNFDLAYVPFQMGSDPDDGFLFRCNGVANYARWCDRTVDALEVRALSTVSPAERKRIYARIEAIVARSVPIVFLFDPSYIYAYDRRLSGFHPNAFSPTWNAAGWSVK